MKSLGLVVFLTSLCEILASNGHHGATLSKQDCTTMLRLQDKWHFLNEKKTFVRIKARHFVFKQEGEKPVKYKCMEKHRNVYLLRKKNYRKGESAVLCVVLRFIADHPKAEYAMRRLIGPGEGSSVMSPVILPNQHPASIATTCDLEGRFEDEESDDFKIRAFLRRAPPGCKFAKNVQGRWNYTYQHAKSLEIWKKNSTLHLMNGKSIKFECDRKEDNIYIFRAIGFVNPQTDAIMCAALTPTDETDRFYKFKLSRHNSGHLLDNQLKAVPKTHVSYVNLDCNWIDSPARPEFLYP